MMVQDVRSIEARADSAAAVAAAVSAAACLRLSSSARHDTQVMVQQLQGKGSGQTLQLSWLLPLSLLHA